MDQHSTEQQISFKELIKYLITYWKIVIGFPLVFGIVAFVFLWFLVNPTYEARLEGIISIPESVETQYGSYAFSENTVKDILAYVVSDRVMEKWVQTTVGDAMVEESSIEVAVKKVSVKMDEESNQFTIKLKANSPALAKEQLKVLSNVFIEEVNLRYKKMALGFFYAQLNNSILLAENEKEVIEKQLVGLEKIIETLEPAISLKRLMLSNPVYAAQVANERGIPQALLTEEMMLEEVINPNYQALEMQIIDIKKRIAVIEVENEINKRHLNDIKYEDEAITKLLLGDSSVKINNRFLNVMSSRMIMKDTVSVNNSPIAPRKSLSLAVALVVGLMVGVFITFLIAYWKADDKN